MKFNLLLLFFLIFLATFASAMNTICCKSNNDCPSGQACKGPQNGCDKGYKTCVLVKEVFCNFNVN